jgi:hypothetical protein
MPDTKITALTAIGANPIIPSTFPIPMVDLTDTSMAASGTTKKVTVNQILGAGGTATLASATITGDLTVDTSTLKVDSANNRVGIGTVSPARPLDIVGSFQSSLGWVLTGTPAGLGAATRYIGGASTTDSWYYNGVTGGSHIWAFGESTAMTLNSTGLGVGASPSERITVNSSTAANYIKLTNSGATTGFLIGCFNTTVDIRNKEAGAMNFFTSDIQRMQIDASGNVGVGVTPSAWGSNSKALEVGGGSASVSSTGAGSTASRFAHGAYFDNTNWLYQYTGVGPALYQVTGANAGSTHAWYIAPGGTAGNAITFTQAMTLDASGNLLVGTTTAAGKITALAGASGQAAVFQQPAQNFWCVLAHNQATSGDNSFVLFGTEASFTSRGSITYNRAAGQVAYNITSDYRLKEDIKPLTGAINRITSLKPSTYKLKETGSVCEGFIAHELAEVVPMAVTGEKDAVDADGKPVYQAVDLSKVTPLLVAAIKELTARVEALEA